jgi:hypothetical protein
VTSVFPNTGATGVDRAVNPVVGFDEAMDASTFDGAVFLKNLKTGRKVPISVGPDGAANAYIDPYPADAARLLPKATKFKITVKTTVTDAAGNPLTSVFTSTFKTGA